MVLPGGLSSRAVPSCHAREALGLGASGAGFGTDTNERIEIIARISAGPLNGRCQLVPSGNWSP
ncbi:hypothetical protein AB0G83_10830 [Streptomyces klenkii]|uniref:hypothetical protein n=1 Tax=Streptomyces klenkii TaxID=1420899 RepID=UPI0033D24B68